MEAHPPEMWCAIIEAGQWQSACHLKAKRALLPVHHLALGNNNVCQPDAPTTVTGGG